MILSGPVREPATRCVLRVGGGMVRWGRDSLYTGFLRRDWTSGRVVILVSTPGASVCDSGCVCVCVCVCACACACDLTDREDENKRLDKVGIWSRAVRVHVIVDRNGLARYIFIVVMFKV